MINLVIDASVLVKLFLKGEINRKQARLLVDNSIKNEIDLIAPPIFTGEVDSVIRKRTYDGNLTDEGGEKYLFAH